VSVTAVLLGAGLQGLERACRKRRRSTISKAQHHQQGAAPSARCTTISKVRRGLTPAILAIYATVLLAVATLRLRRSLVTP